MYMPRRMMFSRPVASGLNPSVLLSSADLRPETWTAPFGRVIDARENLEERRFACAVCSDEGNAVAVDDIQGHAIQSADNVLIERIMRDMSLR